jgi:sugar-phosphatase
VLVESMALIERILREWAAEHAIDADLAVAMSHGRRDIDLIGLVAPHLDAAAETSRIVAKEERDFSGLVPVPGAADLLASLPAERWAVVTSGSRLVARGRLDAVGLPRPRHLVTADDIAEGKPHPEGYLHAAALLGVPPADCLVVEDAPSGVAAATAAGMRCVGRGETVAALDDALLSHVDDLRGLRVVDTGAAGLVVEITDMPGERSDDSRRREETA